MWPRGGGVDVPSARCDSWDPMPKPAPACGKQWHVCEGYPFSERSARCSLLYSHHTSLIMVMCPYLLVMRPHFSVMCSHFSVMCSHFSYAFWSFVHASCVHTSGFSCFLVIC